MEFESHVVSEEYAREFINILVVLPRIKKYPEKKTVDWFKRFPVWITFTSLFLLGTIGWFVTYFIMLSKKGIPTDKTVIVLSVFMALVFGILTFLLLRNIKTYASMLNLKKKFMQKERNVIYRFDEKGFLYDEVGSKTIQGRWKELDSVIIGRYGCYLAAKDITKFSVLGVPNTDQGTVGDYVIDNEINVRTAVIL